MTSIEKLVNAYERAQINVAFRKKIESLITPEALAAALISFVAAFLVAQVTPVGWAADIALFLTRGLHRLGPRHSDPPSDRLRQGAECLERCRTRPRGIGVCSGSRRDRGRRP